MTHQEKIWFARVEDKVFGPVALHTLQHWAATGGITASVEITRESKGKDPTGPWQPAGDLSDLSLEWQVQDPDGNAYDACHVLALREEVLEGRVQPFWDIIHLPTGERYQVVDALCSALLEQNQILEVKMADTLARLHNFEILGPTAEADPLGDSEPSPDNWGEVMRARDQSAREAEKWKKFYDEELVRNRTREAELLAQIDELRAWQRKASERIKALERRRTQLEEASLLPGAEQVGGQDRDLRRAYQELRMQLDQLTSALDLRRHEMEAAQDRLQEVDAQLVHEREARKQEVEREKTLRLEAREHLTRIEQAHIDLTRSYRDLNERMIRLRNSMEAPDRVPLQRDAATESNKPTQSTPVTPDDVPPPPLPGKLKIKLT